MAHNLFEELMQQKKAEYSITDIIIILSSQYYNIVDFDIYISNLNPNDPNIYRFISKLLSVCESFQNNLMSVDANLTWTNKDEQILTVEKVKKSCQSYLDM